MKRKTYRRKSRKTRKTRRYKKQRGGNIMNSVRIPEGAVVGNPTYTDGGYKYEEVSTP
jgi:hypothetical protein